MTKAPVRSAAHIFSSRRWQAAALVVVIAAAAAVYLTTRGSSTASAQTTYRVTTAALGTVSQSVSTTGTLEPAAQDSLNFQVSGKVTAVRVSAGDHVRKGQLLASVNAATLQADLAQAQASLANQQASLSAAEDADASDAQIAADKAAVSASKQSVTSAQASLADARLVSPINGIVASVDLAVGDQVTSGASSGSAGSAAGSGSATGSSSTAQFLVISDDTWVVTSSVDATEVGLVAKGDQAQITVSGATSQVFGTISSVGLLASSSSSSTSGSSSSSASYEVDIAVTGNPSGLHAGSSVTVNLIYKQLSNVLTVPTLAVTAVNGKSVVYVSSDGTSNGKRVATVVTTGLASSGLVQIKSGIAAGAKVLVAVNTARRGGATSTTGNNSQTRGNRFGGGTGGYGGGTGGFGGGAGGGGAGGFGGGTGGAPGGGGN